jgi:hypothetical protein
MIWRCPTCGEQIETVETENGGETPKSDAQQIIDHGGIPAIAIPCGHAIDLSD